MWIGLAPLESVTNYSFASCFNSSTGGNARDENQAHCTWPSKKAPLFTIVGGVVLINPVYAQNAPAAGLEEVIVTGMRVSMRQSMEVKRDSIGVVEAITAEDIGRFPNTNLAESLQRIPGVAIDRQNGEGAQVTVRGFGPAYNLVTLNGRTVPTAEVNVWGNRDNYAGGQGRSFDFSNIAAEGVSSLEVFKTGQAILPSGGIGATLNVNTRRPFDTPGMQATVGRQGRFTTPASKKVTTSRPRSAVCSAGPTTTRRSASACSAPTRNATRPPRSARRTTGSYAAPTISSRIRASCVQGATRPIT